MDYDAILDFWFNELDPVQWWRKDPELDLLMKERFTGIYNRACAGELYQWRETAKGRLAEIIILDQFPRNMFRGSAQAFATDSMAVALTQEAIRSGDDLKLTDTQRSFLYMPFMHSESLQIHQIAKPLFEATGIEGSIESAKQHADIIQRFGRYPHRNQVLWRESTEEEMEFLEQPGSSF